MSETKSSESAKVVPADKSAGGPFSLGTARRVLTFGGMAIAGVNLPTIGRVLGHLNLNATQIYARLDMEAARRALEANAKTLPLSLPTVMPD